MVHDLVIRGGTVLLDGGATPADVAVDGEHIAAIGVDLQGDQEIDAKGKLVIPGAVDPHVHLEMPVGSTQSSDDWVSGTVASACGGTTTVIDFVEPDPGQPLLQALQSRRSLAMGQAVIDFGLHMTLCNADQETLVQVADVVTAGCPSFKTYLLYEDFYLDDASFLKALEAVRQAGGIALVHAENHAIVEHLRTKFVSAGQREPKYHALSHPPMAEAEAVERAIALAQVIGADLYVVHVSVAASVEAIQRAHERGLPVYGETCPQYLLLTEDVYEHPDFEGAKFVCSPPLRKASDAERLWQALSEGTLQVVATDHCPFFYHGQKDLGRESFDHIPGGLPSIEARVALMYTYGVGQGRITLRQWIKLCCTAPARRFGLHPRKGVIAPGSDADIVVFDPELEVTLSRDSLHEIVDYTPYDGFRLKGYPIMTFSRGTLIAQDGEFCGPSGHGQFLMR